MYNRIIRVAALVLALTLFMTLSYAADTVPVSNSSNSLGKGINISDLNSDDTVFINNDNIQKIDGSYLDDTSIVEVASQDMVPSAGIPKAYPGAQGYGTQTRGGAGGKIVRVTSLAASGAGTLKEALEDTIGKRIIVFDVSGTIDLIPLGRAIQLRGEEGSNVTIAGQTAPGEGIQLKGYGITMTNVHDVIMRFIKIRIGNVAKAGNTYQSDPFSGSGLKRVVLDHLTFNWSIDMGFRVYGEEVTMANTMISKAMQYNTPHEKGPHNYAGMFGPKYGSFYNNYLSDNGQRSPRIVDSEFVDVRNNVVFNSKYTFDICNYEWQGANTKYNIVNNAVLKGSIAPAGSTSNTTTGGSYKYFQGRDYSGGLLAYSRGNIDNTKGAYPVLKDSGVGPVLNDTTIMNELQVYSKGGYSNIVAKYRDMVYPTDISLSDYDVADVSHKGNTIMPYPFVTPDMYTRTADEAAKFVINNVGASRDILSRRYLAEAKSRLKLNSDYDTWLDGYGIIASQGQDSVDPVTYKKTTAQESLDRDTVGNTRYKLPVELHKIYKDANGLLIHDKDGTTDTTGLTLVKWFKFVRDAIYVTDADGNKYLFTEESTADKARYKGVYDNFDVEKDVNGYDVDMDFHIYDSSGTELIPPTPYTSDSESNLVGQVFTLNEKTVTINWTTWGDGPGNYKHETAASNDPSVDTGTIDTEWKDTDWPQISTIYRESGWDTNRDGIPEYFIKKMGWDKNPGYSPTKDISRLDFEGRGYTNIEYYINDECAGDKEIYTESIDPIIAENIRLGSKNNTYRSYEILFNTMRRAKAKIEYCEGPTFDENNFKTVNLNKNYNYDPTNTGTMALYSAANDFETYFSVRLPGVNTDGTPAADLKPNTTYSYRIRTYSESGIQNLSGVYNFTTKPLPTEAPKAPNITSAISFDRQVTLYFEPYYDEGDYYQTSFDVDSASDANKQRYITSIGTKKYDKSIGWYVLRYGTSPDSLTNEVTISADSSKYVIPELENARAYYFDLRAVNGVGESGTATYNQRSLNVYRDQKGDLQYPVVNNIVDFNRVPITPTKYIINEDFTKTVDDNMIEGSTPMFTALYSDIKNWYIYTLGGRPIPTKFQGNNMLLVKDDLNEHGFNIAKKYETPLSGKSTIECKLLIANEHPDPMGTPPETRFYVQQDAAQSEDTDIDTDTEATTFGNIASLSFSNGNISYNANKIMSYSQNTWYDIKLLFNGNSKTLTLYINGAPVLTDAEYSEDSTSSTIARWQLSSRLAGTQDVYIQNIKAYSSWDPNETSYNEPATGTGNQGGSKPSTGGTAPGETTPGGSIGGTIGNGSTGIGSTSNDGMFKDLSGVEWAKDAIVSLAKNGVIKGVGDGYFAPNNTVTRAEFITMLMRAYNLIDPNSTSSFTDVTKDAWHYGAISSAYNLGIVSGYDDGRFGVDDRITRQDMTVMSYRLINKLGKTLTVTRDYPEFSDEDQISYYAKESINLLYRSGIISGMGDNTFIPSGIASRAQAAQIIYGLVNANNASIAASATVIEGASSSESDKGGV